MKIERRFTELRQEGRRLSGVAIRYGAIAVFPWGRERFEAGAFGDVSQLDVILNSHHERARPLARTAGGGLQLVDTETELTIRADLPPTSEANDVLALVRSGVLRGLSIEFSAQDERLEEGDLRIVERAKLSAIGVVDRPQYETSTVQARRRRGRSFLKAGVPYGKSLACRCHTGKCNKVQFEPDTFAETLADPENEVLAIVGEYSGAIASRRRGSLILKSTRDGLEITILEAARTDAARDLAAMAKTVNIFARPVFADPIQFVESGAGDAAVATYRKARLRAILIGPTDADGGWTPADVGPVPARRRQKRRQVWL